METILESMAKMLVLFAIPTAVGYFLTRRWRIVAIVLWLLLPVFVGVGLTVREFTLSAPDETDFGLYGQAFGYIFVFGVLLFEICSGAGFALGFTLRRKRSRPDAEGGIERPPAIVQKPPIPPPAIRPDVGREGWVARHIGFEHDGLVLDGVNIWAGEWRPVVGRPVELPHPSYPDQLHEFRQYDVAEGPRSIRVAATELSNGVWGFYTWRADDIVRSAVTANGLLRYENHYPDVVGRRPDSLATVAFIWNATTFRLIADGSAWTSSRIAAEEDGTLLLSLRHFDRDALFRIDPLTWRFQAVGLANGPESLDRLADMLWQVHADIIAAKGFTGLRLAPDGSVRVELAAVEWSNTHWVNSPKVIDIASDQVLLDLWNTDWDAEVSFPYALTVALRLRRYRSPGAFYVELDLANDSFALFDESEGPPLQGKLGGLVLALAKASDTASRRARPQGSVRRTSPRVGKPQWLVAFVILGFALAAIAAISAVVYSLETPPVVKLTPLPKMPGQ
jgi:hypothetical protein